MQPNILFIITHDTGRYLGCYHKQVKTPNLDRLANEGAIFTNHFCPAPQCSPSRGSIMTGRYPHRNGLIGLAHLGFELNPAEQTLPTLLGKAGYATYLFGVQHESKDPARLGYQYIAEQEDRRAEGSASCRCFPHPRAGQAQPFLPWLVSLKLIGSLLKTILNLTIRPRLQSLHFFQILRKYAKI